LPCHAIHHIGDRIAAQRARALPLPLPCDRINAGVELHLGLRRNVATLLDDARRQPLPVRTRRFALAEAAFGVLIAGPLDWPPVSALSVRVWNNKKGCGDYGDGRPRGRM
jgi:hypothetical protein